VSHPDGYSACMCAALELWLFVVTDPLTGKRRRTSYRMTLEEARLCYANPEAVPSSLERREVEAKRPGQRTQSWRNHEGCVVGMAKTDGTIKDG